MTADPTRRISLDSVGIGLLGGVLIAIAAGATASIPNPGGSPSAPETAPPAPHTELATTTADPADLTVRRTAVVEAVERVAPAVVSITTETADYSRYFGAPQTASGEGSGVVIAPDGVVLTNAHVIERAHRITATFADERSFDADLVGIAPDLDLAVLRLRGADGLAVAEVARSSELLLGEPVIAIGNPFGLGHTVTTGVVSATSRPLETDQRVYQDFIQTDASINPGNSGGPLLDATGRLIGINTAIRPDAEGIGFAIPVDRAMKVARDLIDFGTVQVPWLGVDLEDTAFRSRTGRVVAAQVVRVHPGSAASAAGIRAGDIIRSLDDRIVQGRSDMNAYLSSFEPGHTVTIGVLRDAGPATVPVETTRLPEAILQATLAEVLGVTLTDIALRGGDRAVQVSRVSPKGSFARRGLRAGDLIIGINGRQVESVATLERLLTQAKSEHRPAAMLTIQRGAGVGRFTLPI